MIEPLAHIGGDSGPQSLSSHLSGVAHQAARHAAKIGMPLAGELIGLLHDLGKSTEYFQTYLRSFQEDSPTPPQQHLRGKIDHSSAGAQCLVRNIPGGRDPAQVASIVASLLGLCIVSHHSGLIDCLGPDGTDTLTARFERNETKTRFEEAWSTLPTGVRTRAEALMCDPELVSQCRRKLRDVAKSSFGDSDVQLGLLVRTLFSCLIDADRTDTADHEKPRSAQHRQQGKYTSWEVLRARLDDGLRGLPTGGRVNEIRANVSEQCLGAAARSTGMYTLTVPTGGGKTLAGLRFALEHARIHNLDRVVFVSPYISIVDQNAAVARTYLEKGADYASVVLEHHSDLARDRERMRDRSPSGEPDIDGWRRRVLAENWDAPVVFTTMVQVLESLFGAGTSSARRLHALARSVIVFDEVQTLPVKLVHLFNNAVNFLTTHCGSTVLLCTATQPLLADVDSTLGAAHLAPNSELIADVAALQNDLRRYTVLDESGRGTLWTHEELARRICQEASAHGSCLAILNTKRDALLLFEQCRALLPDATLLHLSTGMCPAHRSEALARLHSGLPHATCEAPVICISTQLIEAGVDIDFAVVVRDLAGLDSLAQAAGRCNRHGVRSEPGRVVIVELPDPPKHLQEILEGRKAARIILGRWHKEHPGEPVPLHTDEMMRSFYEQYFFDRKLAMHYWLPAQDGRPETSMLTLLGSNDFTASSRRGKPRLPRNILLQSFATANEAFELIGPTQGIVVPFRDHGKEMINELCSSQNPEVEWQLLRKAQQYSVSVHPHTFRMLEDKGAIYPAQLENGVFCLRSEWYDPEFGLRDVAGMPESLIV